MNTTLAPRSVGDVARDKKEEEEGEEEERLLEVEGSQTRCFLKVKKHKPFIQNSLHIHTKLCPSRDQKMLLHPPFNQSSCH